MQYLFLQQEFPGRFGLLAPVLGARPGNSVVFLAQNNPGNTNLPGVRFGLVPVPQAAHSNNHAEMQLNRSLRTAEAFGNAMLQLKDSGFTPDVILEHTGTSAGLFMRDIFPEAKRICFCDWYYNRRVPYNMTESHMAAFFAPLHLRNLHQLDALADCRLALCPTAWQRAQYPASIRPLLQVQPFEVDARQFSPARSDQAGLLPDFFASAGATELVSFVADALEPCRGFPQFFRSLPAILEARPSCHVVIAAEDRTGYDSPRQDGQTWLEAMRGQVRVDASRVHLLPGNRTQTEYISLLRHASVHVHLTAPYTLDISLLEAMSSGCCVVASDTRPVNEVIAHQHNGLLVPFNDPVALSRQVIAALNNPEQRKALGQAARATVLQHYNADALLPLLLRRIRESVEEEGI